MAKKRPEESAFYYAYIGRLKIVSVVETKRVDLGTIRFWRTAHEFNSNGFSIISRDSCLMIKIQNGTPFWMFDAKGTMFGKISGQEQRINLENGVIALPIGNNEEEPWLLVRRNVSN